MAVYHLYYRCSFVKLREVDLFKGRISPEEEVEEPVPTTVWGKIVDKLM